jgi:chromosome segregation ATPase
MSSRSEDAETLGRLNAKIIRLQNKLAKRNDEYSALVEQVRQAREKGMSREEQRRHIQKMRVVSSQIRTIERRFDHLWDKKFYFLQLYSRENGN